MLGFSLGTYLRSMDWILLGATLGLVVYGFFMLYSATHSDPTISSPFQYVRSQAIGLALGLEAAADEADEGLEERLGEPLFEAARCEGDSGKQFGSGLDEPLGLLAEFVGGF